MWKSQRRKNWKLSLRKKWLEVSYIHNWRLLQKYPEKKNNTVNILQNPVELI